MMLGRMTLEAAPVGAHHPAASWHHAFGTFAPDTATAALSKWQSLGLLPRQEAAQPISRATSKFVVLRPCTVTADAMRRSGG